MKIGCWKKFAAVLMGMLLAASVWANCHKDSCGAAKKENCGEKTKQCDRDQKQQKDCQQKKSQDCQPKADKN